jgi:hypothetical protein
MIGQIAQIAKIENLLANLKTARFNAVLPVTIDVLKKSEKNANEYQLQIGNKEIMTKSAKELDVGAKYWGVMKEDKDLGTLNLSQLLKKPKLLQMQRKNFLPELNDKTLQNLISKENPKAELKSVLLEKLSQSVTKNEFMTLTNMISALNENVFTMVLKEDNQSTMFQFKKRKKSSAKSASSEDATIDFYAAFEHLGPVEGVVSVIDDEKKLTMSLFYKESVDFLKEQLPELDFEGVLYKKDREIEPIYELSASLLDTRG